MSVYGGFSLWLRQPRLQLGLAPSFLVVGITLALLIGTVPASQTGAKLKQGRTTYYVSPAGSDQSPGTEAKPFRTMHHGMRRLRAGDTLYVRAGTYNEALIDDLPSGNSWSAPVTVAAYPGEAVTLRPSGTRFVVRCRGGCRYIVLNGFTFDGSLVTDSAVYISSSKSGSPDHIRLSNSEVKNAPRQGVIVESEKGYPTPDHNEFLNLKVHDNGRTELDHGFYIQSNYNLVQGCDVYGNAGWGIHVYKSKGTNSRDAGHNTICGNKSHDNARAKGHGVGIGLYVGDSNVAYNNVVWNNQVGITVEIGASKTKVYNNTIYKNGSDGGIRIGYAKPGVTTNTIIRNNILWQNTHSIRDYGTGTVEDHNLTTDPLFVNAAAGDFHLQAGSPAIDIGTTLSLVGNDFDGVRRPQGRAYDLGAYEFH